MFVIYAIYLMPWPGGVKVVIVEMEEIMAMMKGGCW
jgi:hypothetical protein